jgi:hypothetical protein
MRPQVDALGPAEVVDTRALVADWGRSRRIESETELF